MARKARGASPEGVYHIQQRSTSHRSLFESDADRMKFLQLLKDTKQKYGIKLYAYCLEDQNTYHIIIHANGSDLSKLMKSLNIAYAMYVGLDGPLFKDRYKSKLIDSACTYESIRSDVVYSKNEEMSCFNSDPMYCDDENPFDAICIPCLKSIEEAYSKLELESHNQNLTIEALLKNKGVRNALIVEFRKSSLLSLKDLGKLFGGLSESTVSKILKSAQLK
jgi:REP element-mobilizing transposase RayT